MFRARASLSVFLGPFIVLGSLIIALKDSSVRFLPDFDPKPWAAILAIGYLGIGLMSAMIENHGWRICNRYRRIIKQLHESPQAEIVPVDDPPSWLRRRILDICELLGIKPKESKKIPGIEARYRTKGTYMVTYALMLVMFISAIYLISHLEITARSPQTPGGQPSPTSQTNPK
jgi:hypothetical protein